MQKYYDQIFLYHHGVKGQKWGVRRYRNYDGTLTSLGKKRLGSNTKSIKNSSLSNKKKAEALSFVGNHSESAKYYKKDFYKNEKSLKYNSLIKKLASILVAEKIVSGDMSLSDGLRELKLVHDGQYIADRIIEANMFDSAVNYIYEVNR